MIYDWRDLESDTVLTSDVCIIGGGAAGIAIAREFRDTGLKVCVLEAGGQGITAESQALCAGENAGHPYFGLDETRFRCLGGTTERWSRGCLPLVTADFQPRAWMPFSGWPLTLDEIVPYYRRAHTLCKLGPDRFDRSLWRKGWKDDIAFDEKRIEARLWQFTPFTNLASAYREEIEKAQNIDLYLNAIATRLVPDDDNLRVRYVDVQSQEGPAGRVEARFFVLAAGGLETPRLLLISNEKEESGLGNRHDLVGRYFMEHPRARSGVLEAPDLASLAERFQRFRTDGVTMRCCLSLSETAQRREQVASALASVDIEGREDSGVQTLKSLMRAIKHRDFSGFRAGRLLSVLSDLDEVAVQVGRRLRGRPTIPPIGSLFLMVRGEQAPNPDSRVQLSAERDSLGLPRIKLDWRLSEFDKRSMRALVEALSDEFARLGLAKVRPAEWLLDRGNHWPDDLVGNHHHMGTTRMSDAPTSGVVDRDCGVHGVSNLYVAGSSVFSTGGHANPTFTILALSLRLADHLKAQFIS